MKKIIIFITLYIFGCEVHAYVAKSNVEIKNIRVRPNVAYVKFEGCARYSRIFLTNDYYKAMLSVALTAAAAKKSVTVEFQNGHSCNSNDIEPLINYIDVAI
jgi:hypothetical protein